MKCHQPPVKITQLLKWICKEEYQEEILGDLEEVYNGLRRSHSQKEAGRKYFFYILKFVRWSNLKTPKIMKGINYTLFTRSIRYSLKQYKRHLGPSLLNSLGLAIGISTFISLMAYSYYQLSYDKWLPESERVFRVVTEKPVADNTLATATSAVPLLPNVTSSFNAIESATRLYPYQCFLQKDKFKKYRETVVFADSSTFEVFKFPMFEGDAKTALNGPMKMVISRRMATKYFGEKSPIGERLTFEDDSESADFVISGVMENISENTHLEIDFLASLQSLEQIMPWYDNWHYPYLYSYVKLFSSDTTKLTAAFEEQMRLQTPEHYNSEILSLKFQSIESIHLNSTYENDWKANSNMVYVRIFIIVAILILVISIVNYVNLIVSRGVVRAKEVGMRKVIGADRSQLIFQFMSEALMNVLIAALFSVGMVKLLMIVLRRNMDMLLDINFLSEWPFFGYLLGIFIFLVIATGFYPALVMSSYRPLDAFRQKIPTSGSSFLRKGLVFLQFSISGAMILITLLMLQQSKFLQNKNLGFDQSHLLAIKMVDDFDSQNYEVFKQRLLSESFVEHVAVSSTLPGKGDFHDFDVSSKDIPDSEPFSMKTLGVDEDYFATYKLKLASGRDFDTKIPTDQKSAFILNRAAVAKFGWEDPIGKNLSLTIYTGKREIREGKVIGLAEDFHFESLFKEIEPIVIYINKHQHYTDYLTARLSPGDLKVQVERLEELYAGFNPNKPFEFMFVDDELDKHYENEIKQGNTMTMFSLMAIFLSCLGILGMITYATQKKIKEIGIRKIMGSGRFQILYLFVREYVRLFIPAVIVSGVAVYYFSESWLANFAYSIDFDLIYYIIGFVSLALITLITISYHTIRASSLNPVDCLRDE